MCMFVCLRYSLLTSYNNMSRIPRVQQGGLHLHYTYIRIFSTEHFLHQERPRVFYSLVVYSRVGKSTLCPSAENVLAYDFRTFPIFTVRRLSRSQRSAEGTERGRKREWRGRNEPKEPHRMHPCVFASLSLFPSNLFFSPCPVAPSTPFLSRFPSDARVINTILASCAKLFQPRRGLLRYDIIENKIRTHLLLGQSYPCCQSRCHTHTTLTSTPKSDIVCWNRPSLWLFSRA